MNKKVFAWTINIINVMILLFLWLINGMESNSINITQKRNTAVLSLMTVVSIILAIFQILLIKKNSKQWFDPILILCTFYAFIYLYFSILYNGSVF